MDNLLFDNDNMSLPTCGVGGTHWPFIKSLVNDESQSYKVRDDSARMESSLNQDQWVCLEQLDYEHRRLVKQ